MEWIFEPLGPNGGQSGENPGKHILSKGIDSLVREVIQNSLDAKDPGLDPSEPVRVTLRYNKLDGGVRQEFENVINFSTLRDNLEKCSTVSPAIDDVLKKIDENLAKERLINFQIISKKIKTEYRQTLLAKTMPVLFENKTKDGNKYFGRDEHFNSVIVDSNENLAGKIKNIKITELNQNTLFGEINSKIIREDFAA